MAKDAELDRLKAAQGAAFEQKKKAQQAQQKAWEARSKAQDELNRAHEAKQCAYAEQERTWQYYQGVRSSHGPRIDALNGQQERAFQSMRSAFESASSAHGRRDGASAASYAADGHRYKAEAQEYVAQRRRLVEEIRSARAAHEASKAAFQRARNNFSTAKRAYDAARASHMQAQLSYAQAKEALSNASEAFKARLDKLKSENAQRKDDKRTLAEKAGVPHRYLDDVWISKKPDGSINFYFGGVGKPDGPGHGHYSMDADGKVTYRRDPFNPRGAKNFARDESIELRLSRVALSAFHRERSSTGPREVQYDEDGVTVKVKSGFNRRTGTVATDVIVIDRTASPDEHLHLVLSEHDGAVLFQEWRKNH